MCSFVLFIVSKRYTTHNQISVYENIYDIVNFSALFLIFLTYLWFFVSCIPFLLVFCSFVLLFIMIFFLLFNQIFFSFLLTQQKWNDVIESLFSSLHDPIIQNAFYEFFCVSSYIFCAIKSYNNHKKMS